MNRDLTEEQLALLLKSRTRRMKRINKTAAAGEAEGDKRVTDAELFAQMGATVHTHHHPRT